MKLLVIANPKSLVWGGIKRSKLFSSFTVFFANFPFSLQVITTWYKSSTNCVARLTAWTLSGELPDLAKDTKSVGMSFIK